MEIREIRSFLVGFLVAMGVWFACWRLLVHRCRQDRRRRAVRDALVALERVPPEEYGMDPKEPGCGSADNHLTEWYVLRAALFALLGKRDRRRMDGVREVGRAGASQMCRLLATLLAESMGEGRGRSGEA